MKYLLALLCLLNSVLAAKIFLSPPSDTHATRVSAQLAGSRLAQHLGLEEFESYAGHYTYGEEVFVGKGERSGLLVSVDERDVDHIIPSTLQPAFSIKNAAESFDSLLTTYLRRAQHVYTHIVDSASITPSSERTLDAFFLTIPSSPATEQLYKELSLLNQFLESTDTSSFAAVELRGLSLLRSSLGASSEAYQAASRFTKAFIESAMAQSGKVRLALITHNAALNNMEKRDPQQSPLPNPLPPQADYTTCFSSAETCSNTTNSCSGHGQCVETTKAGASCFVCSCQSSKKNGKTDVWVGEKCERKDVSGPFVLITGTVIALLLVAYGSVSLLAGVGGEELPSTLLGGAVNSRKD